MRTGIGCHCPASVSCANLPNAITMKLTMKTLVHARTAYPEPHVSRESLQGQQQACTVEQGRTDRATQHVKGSANACNV